MKVSEQLEAQIMKGMAPIIDAIIHQLKERVEIENHRPGRIQKIIASEKDLHAIKQELNRFISSSKERLLIEDAILIISEEAKNDIGLKPIVEDIIRAGKLYHDKLNKEVSEIVVHETLQEWLEISDETLQGIYTLGSQFYERHEIKKAIALFTLLTLLNNFIFEPWLALGMAYREEKQAFSALQALTQASLVNLQHPAPHLYAAELYLQMDPQVLQANPRELAKQTFEYCLTFLTDKDRVEYESLIVSLQNEFGGNL